MITKEERVGVTVKAVRGQRCDRGVTEVRDRDLRVLRSCTEDGGRGHETSRAHSL